jgi:hypothetical protein
VTLEPTADDLVAIGGNVMDDRRRAGVMQTATRTTLVQLRRPEFRGLLPMLERPPRQPSPPEPGLATVKPRLRPAV